MGRLLSGQLEKSHCGRGLRALKNPAKMSRGLLARILAHAKEEGWLKPGDVVCDPFGGVGTTGILGAYEGYRCVLCELEEKFCRLAEQNFALHAAKWKILGCPQPVIIQGDSRELCRIVANCDCIVSSPPFDVHVGGDLRVDNKKRATGGDLCMSSGKNFGTTSGNLSCMKPGSVDAIVSSPPYADTAIAHEGQSGDAGSPAVIAKRKREAYGKYSTTPGNLGNLKPGDVSAIIASPPYEKQVAVQDIDFYRKKCIQTGRNPQSPHAQGITSYGQTVGQLGNTQGPTFWEAARDIVAQCHQILKEGGVAIWVTKRYVRGGKIVEFSQDWARLCESVGFEIVCWHKAMLVKETVDSGLFGHKIVKKTERKSFFRRLAEAKNSPRIDWEDVICMRKQDFLLDEIGPR